MLDQRPVLEKRYGRKLKDVIAEAKIKRESSHTPVLSIEKQKEQERLKETDIALKGMLEQWDIHNQKWKDKALKYADKFKDKLESARLLLSKKERAI